MKYSSKDRKVWNQYEFFRSHSAVEIVREELLHHNDPNSGQTGQGKQCRPRSDYTFIRLLLKEKSNQDLHCLLLCLHLLEAFFVVTAVFVWVRTKPLMSYLLTTLCTCQSWQFIEPINTSHWGSKSKVYLYIKGTGTKTDKKNQYLSQENTPAQLSHFDKRWCGFYKAKKLNCSYPNEKSYKRSCSKFMIITLK